LRAPRQAPICGSMSFLAHLPHRGVISVAGADRVAFLNGLVSNDVGRAAPGHAVWAALLTAQGKYVSDFFILTEDDRLLLDAPREAVPDLLARLRRFRLRSAVELADVSEQFQVYAAWGGMPPPGPVTAPDPRLPEAGFRCLSQQVLETNASPENYAAHRLGLGLPDGPPDMEPDRTLLLEAGFDELGGIDWDKGCYMGQELTARTKYRGLVKRRLIPVVLSEAAPPPGTPVLAEGAEVGTLRSSAGLLALASLRLDVLQKPMLSGNALVQPRLPPWMRL
jgi:tRNA-modifying protein YgfZ